MESLFDLEELDRLNSTIDNEDNGSNIILKSNVVQDEYTNYIHEAYDLSIGDTSKVLIPNNLNIESLGDWQIGVICGASGSGKSTILSELCNRGGGKISIA